MAELRIINCDIGDKYLQNLLQVHTSPSSHKNINKTWLFIKFILYYVSISWRSSNPIDSKKILQQTSYL